MTTTHYHRNGVCGVGFHCSIEHGRITVEFNDAEPITVRVPEPDAWGRSSSYKLVGEIQRSDCTVYAYWRKRRRFIGIKSPDLEYGFAAFDADLLPDLTFGVNSWRGDREWAALQKVLA